MRNENKSVGALLGKPVHDLCYFLTMLFCVLRACDVITWKWYWVMSPLIVSKIIGVVALIIAGAVAVSVIKNKNE